MNIEFIIPTWNRPNNLMVILASLVSQSNPNWKAHVIIDGLTDSYRKVKDLYQDENRIRFSHIDGPNKDWGHTPRNIGLEQATEEWVCMTGDDNYYVPEFVNEMLQVSEGQHFVSCNMVHNWVNKEYIGINTALQFGRIDIGCFMVRTNMGNKIKLNTKEEWADWYYVEEFIKKYKHAKFNKLNKILYVHN